ncbi:hypothetical protein [Vibrio neonatus]|uniref:hypothetical protein n=1 Tax=Vibrio neonatus TaxID=278860 RepID=UPI0021C3261C|nr:hypothetical protein [Vibrio neonatus]
MSDYILPTTPQPLAKLTKATESIYDVFPPLISEFQGEWGTLDGSDSYYNGSQPYENEVHIFTVIGRPVPYFRDKAFYNYEN